MQKLVPANIDNVLGAGSSRLIGVVMLVVAEPADNCRARALMSRTRKKASKSAPIGSKGLITAITDTLQAIVIFDDALLSAAPSISSVVDMVVVAEPAVIVIK